jgi:hypothetical protein
MDNRAQSQQLHDDCVPYRGGCAPIIAPAARRAKGLGKSSAALSAPTRRSNGAKSIRHAVRRVTPEAWELDDADKHEQLTVVVNLFAKLE